MLGYAEAYQDECVENRSGRGKLYEEKVEGGLRSTVGHNDLIIFDLFSFD